VSDPRTRDGFTLVELVVVITLFAMVATVITATVAVILRTEDPTSDRSEDARSLRGLTTWLAQDVAATPPTGFDLSGAVVSTCTGATGTPLATLRWTENTGSTSTFIADYRFVDSGTGKEVRRYSCSGTGAPPYAGGEMNRLTDILATTTPTVTPITNGVDTVGLVLTVFSAAGAPLRAEATTRNPANTLAPIPTYTTSSTVAPTTIPTPTTIGTPCTVTDTDWRDDIDRQGNGPLSPLRNPVVMEFTVTTGCTLTMTIQFDRGDTNGVQTRTLSVGASSNLRVVTLPATNSERWTTGDKTVTVLHGSTALSPTYELDID
jgi:prepilin-type N-terminal cleavage/methylation domain-containing protein